jgi:segregation and condensation protein A
LVDYRVNLDIFAGPLDLLLHLVRKEEVDIYDIPIAKITDQYIRYIKMLNSLNIDLAGDFLVMAATLMQIKSAMLLPKADLEELQADDLADPRTELIRQLLEYKKFKDAANLLSAAADETKKRFPRPGTIVEQLKGSQNAIDEVWGPESDTGPEIDLEQVSVWDLLDAFGSIMEATGGTRMDISHIIDDTPIDVYQIEILHRLQTEGPMSFERIFESKTSRFTMIGLFLALLELIREKLVWVKQPKSSASLYLRPLTDEPAEQAVQKAILAAAEANDQQPPIPIAELPPKTRPRTSDPEKEKTESIQDLKPPTGN